LEIYTTGFATRTAERFFEALRATGIKRLVDVRLNNTSQLAGFTKKQDLPYLLAQLVDAEYIHEPTLAPTQDILKAYKAGRMPWDEYEQRFLALMTERSIEKRLDPSLFEVPTVLLCSEATAERCHRRLVVEYLNSRWGGVSAVHL
jgi:uncharacterized protein (DUF488 family)